jgi:hypothetical protein
MASPTDIGSNSGTASQGRGASPLHQLGSPSIQIGIAELHEAEKNGLSFYRKSNEEIAIGIRPDMLIAYAMNAATAQVW